MEKLPEWEVKHFQLDNRYPDVLFISCWDLTKKMLLKNLVKLAQFCKDELGYISKKMCITVFFDL